MYEAIQGTLKEKVPARAIVETGGVFYRLTIPLSTYAKLPSCGSSLLLFLSHIVREDSETLYGFMTKEERDLFELLITVSGIGPKTGAAIVGHMEFALFQKAIQAADVTLLSKIPGIGKKTAERLVIEMKDKLKMKLKKGSLPLSSNIAPIGLDAISALINLGYDPSDAQKAVTKVMTHQNLETDLGRLITASLQAL
jgi:Holliday junction DNA helicase RuvA